MAESELHRFLKEASVKALREDGFTTYTEPEWSSVQFLTWRSYGPDILGIRNSNGTDEYAFVECETKPRPKRILAKNTVSIGVQTKLMKDTRSRLILTIPNGTLRGLDMGIRRDWELWAVDRLSGGKSVYPVCQPSAHPHHASFQH